MSLLRGASYMWGEVEEQEQQAAVEQLEEEQDTFNYDGEEVGYDDVYGEEEEEGEYNDEYEWEQEEEDAEEGSDWNLFGTAFSEEQQEDGEALGPTGPTDDLFHDDDDFATAADTNTENGPLYYTQNWDDDYVDDDDEFENEDDDKYDDDDDYTDDDIETIRWGEPEEEEEWKPLSPETLQSNQVNDQGPLQNAYSTVGESQAEEQDDGTLWVAGPGLVLVVVLLGLFVRSRSYNRKSPRGSGFSYHKLS